MNKYTYIVLPESGTSANTQQTNLKEEHYAAP